MDDAELLRPHHPVEAATDWFNNEFDYSNIDFNDVSLDNLPPLPAALRNLYSLDEQEDVPGPLAFGEATLSTASAILPDIRPLLQTSSPSQPISSPTTLVPLSLLERETHETRQRMEKQWMEGKATVDSYQRHFNNYDSYIARLNQENLNRPDWVLVTAHPITRTKVAKFLEYETARTKRTRAGEVIANSSLGAESIKQAISALEYARKNHVHEDAYRQCPESQLKLREDPRIQTFQKAALANEANRRSKGHVLKAQGTANHTYKPSDIANVSRTALQASEQPQTATPIQIWRNLRDRTMFLFSTSLALRGDSTRNSLLSDLGIRELPMLDVAGDAVLKAMTLLRDKSKTNVTAENEVHGAIRHKDVDVCPVGSLAFYLWAEYDVLVRAKKKTLPVFVPDFSDPQGGSMGIVLGTAFISFRQDLMMMVSPWGTTIITFQSDEPWQSWSGNKDAGSIGRWSAGLGSLQVYNGALPRKAMLAAASFNHRKPELYCLPREKLEPPPELIKNAFPWIEQERAALAARRKSVGRLANDPALDGFLDLLLELRRVLLQDGAVLYSQFPGAPLFTHFPFNTVVFRQFAASSQDILTQAEAEAKLQLSQMPETYASLVRNSLVSNEIEARKLQAEIQRQGDRVEETLASLNHDTRPSKRHKVAPVGSTRSCTVVPTTPSRSSTAHPSSPPPIISSPPLPLASPSETVPQPNPLVPAVEDTSFTSTSGARFLLSVFPLSGVPALRQQQLTGIDELVKKFSAETLHHHSFAWDMARKDWLVEYSFYVRKSGSASVDDVWREHMFGMCGQLSIQQISVQWGTRWRRNNDGLKSEQSRRKKITDTISALINMKRWSDDKAVKFIEDAFTRSHGSAPTSARAVHDWMIKKKEKVTHQRLVLASAGLSDDQIAKVTGKVSPRK
ncbi:hypothetical protein BDZ89DRAFT_1128464 [Hymenopellis radicata]|nr:hypothetical protein BDZ89DRAFT_1128464 [Hymenopellis radicata]